MPAIAEAAIQIVPDFDRFGRELDTGVRKSLRGVRGTLSSLTNMAKLFGGALAGSMSIIAAQSVKAQAEFEKNIQMIEGLVGITDPKQLQGFKDAISEIAPATGQSAQDLSKAMFFITSAGARGQTAIEILDSTARLGAAGLGNLSEIARGVVSAVNAYGESNMNAAQAADIFANTVRLGNLEASTLAPTLGQVIPIASQMGVGFDQVGGALAGLTRLGMSASESTTSLRATLSQILSPSVQSEKALNSIGLTFEQLRDALSSGKLDLLGVLQLLQDSFEGNTAAIAEAFPNLRALRGVLGLVGSNLEDNRMIMDAMRDSTGVATEAFDAQVGTLQFEMNQALSAYRTLLIKVGEALAPFLIPMLNDATASLLDQHKALPQLIFRFGEYFNVLKGNKEAADAMMSILTNQGHVNSSTNKLLVRLQEFGEMVRTIFGGVRDSVTRLTTAFIEQFSDLFPTLEGFSFTMADVGNAIAFALSKATDFIIIHVFPIIRQLVEIGMERFSFFRKILVELALKVKENFGQIMRIVKLVGEVFKEVFDFVVPFVKKVFEDISTFIMNIMNPLLDFIEGTLLIIKGLFQGNFDFIKQGAKQAFEGLLGIVKTVVVDGIPLLIDFFVLRWFKGFASLTKGFFTPIKNAFFNMNNMIFNTIGVLFLNVTSKFKSLGTVTQGIVVSFVAFVSTKFGDMMQSVKDAVRKGIDFITGILSHFGTAIITGSWMKPVGEAIGKVVDKFKEFKDKVKEKLDEVKVNLVLFVISALAKFKDFKDGIMEKVREFGTKIKEGFMSVFGNDGSLRKVINAFFDKIFIPMFEQGVVGVVKLFITGISKLIDFVKNFGTTLANTIGNLFDKIKDRIISGIVGVINSLNKAIDRYNSIVPSGLEVGKIPTPNFGGLQDGGTALTTGSAIVGETGPEMITIPKGASVTPLSSVTGTRSGIDRGLERALQKQVNVIVELDSETIAAKTAPIMVDTIRLRQGITIV